MSSLNPFAARREKQEEKMRAKISELQAAQHEQQQSFGGMGGGGLGGGDGALTEAQLSALLPDRSGGYESEDLDK